MAMKLLPGMVVVIPDYTLYPNAGYEQMTQEVAAALTWTLENIHQYGGDPERVVIAGHSSGGHLVGLTVMDPRFLGELGHKSDEVCGMIGLSTGYDIHAQYAYEQSKNGTGDTHLMKTMVGVMGGKENFSKASPINYTRSALPNTLLIHGDADQTVPITQALEFRKAMQNAGAKCELKIYPDQGHSEILFNALMEQKSQIVTDLSAFVHRCTQNNS